ncbi:MAG: UvrD-helicase domain-containing protein [Acidimicrobiales bacterium]|nr:UvrD-helicase domain-containing protein [Acidimicrobiales bacterium]
MTGKADAGARRRIHEDHASTLFVEAGAGTGKTSALVQRVVALLVQGKVRNMRSLAAITFTEKAAAELRDRIRHELEVVAGGGTDHSPEAVQRAHVALAQIDEAAIGTLHGFAQRLISEFPLEAGVPAGFEVRDPVSAAIDFGERWGIFVDDLFADANTEELLARGFALGLRLAHLREVAAEFHENWDRLVDVTFDTTASNGIVAERLLDSLRSCVELAAAHPRDRLAQAVVEEFGPFVERLEALIGGTALRPSAAILGPDHELLIELLEETPSFSFGNRGSRTDAAILRLRKLLGEAEDELLRLLASLRRGVLLPLLERVRRFTLEGVTERLAAGQLEFHDLLVLARQLLRDHAEVRKVLSHRFDVILIDEFQDTDPLQLDIAVLLALAEIEYVPDRWHEGTLTEGKLFFVGDPKQSIYRFRRADIALYDRAKAVLGAGSPLELVTNFRTVPGIIDWVNEVFGRLLGAGVAEAQPAYLPLVAGRQSGSGHADLPAPVLTLGGPHGNLRMGEIRELEALDIAAAIRHLHDSGYEIEPRGEDRRALRFDDIAILLPTRTALGDIERALEVAEVPYRVESRSLVFGSDEVRELVNILQAIDNPADEVALVAALRSPGFACSDRDLAEYRAAGGRWAFYAQVPDGLTEHNPVPVALQELRALHELRPWISVSKLIERVISQCQLVELARAQRRTRDSWRRLRLVLDEARAFMAAGGTDLGEFLEWVTQQAELGAARVEAIVPEPDHDAVRILTIHAAKGLEFPVVVLAGLNVAHRPRTDRVIWDVDGRVEVAIGLKAERFTTEGYEALAEQEQVMDALERQRLLYVACTRARDLLVLSLHHKERADCHAATLWAIHQDLPPDLVAPFPLPDELVASDGEDRADQSPVADTFPATAPSQESTTIQVLESEELAEALEAWQRTHASLVDRISQPEVVVPSKLYGSEANTTVVAVRRGRAGTAVGRAVHGTLQVIDLERPDDLEAIASAQAAQEGVPTLAATVVALARAALASDPVREAVSGGRYWREMFVVAPLGKRVIEGYIDLLYERADGTFAVIDYKTDQAANEAELDAALAGYRLQGAAYAVAVEEALGVTVSRCAFVFCKAGGAVVRELFDLADAMAEVRAEVRGTTEQ